MGSKSTHLLYVLIFTQYYAVGCFDWYYNLINQTGYDRSTDQTDKSADLSEFADYRYYRSDKPLYQIGIWSADYKGTYRLIGMGIKRAHIGANLVKFEPLKYIWTP